MVSEKNNMLKGCLFFFKVNLEYCNQMNLILPSNFCWIFSYEIRYVWKFLASGAIFLISLSQQYSTMITNHKTSQFPEKGLIHPATKQLLPYHLMPYVEKLSFGRSINRGGCWCLVRQDPSHHRPAWLPQGLREQLALDTFITMAHQLGNYECTSHSHSFLSFLTLLNIDSYVIGNISSKPTRCENYNLDKWGLLIFQWKAKERTKI